MILQSSLPIDHSVRSCLKDRIYLRSVLYLGNLELTVILLFTVFFATRANIITLDFYLITFF